MAGGSTVALDGAIPTIMDSVRSIICGRVVDSAEDYLDLHSSMRDSRVERHLDRRTAPVMRTASHAAWFVSVPKCTP